MAAAAQRACRGKYREHISAKERRDARTWRTESSRGADTMQRDKPPAGQAGRAARPCTANNLLVRYAPPEGGQNHG